MGADLSGMSPTHASPAGRQRLQALCGATDDAVLLLYAGRLAPEKNLKLLFKLLEYLNRNGCPPFHLIVAGDGMERRLWEQRAAEQSPGRVVFLGHIRNRKMLAMLYANADIFVHPNPHEPFGIAPLEAMASGLPLVAPNSGGVTTYASSANAWTVPPTVGHFAEAVHEILSHRELAVEKTQLALATAAAYSWDRVADGFLDLYQDMYDCFHGKTPSAPPDFYSLPATPGTKQIATWTARLAQKVFAATARWRESSSVSQPGASANTDPSKYAALKEPRIHS